MEKKACFFGWVYYNIDSTYVIQLHQDCESMWLLYDYCGFYVAVGCWLYQVSSAVFWNSRRKTQCMSHGRAPRHGMSGSGWLALYNLGAPKSPK